MEVQDFELIQRYQKGDEKAFHELVRRHLTAVYRFVFQFCGSESEAEDIAQDTFVKAWKNLAKFDLQKNFRPWLFTIAKNSALDALRLKKGLPLNFFDNEEDDISELEKVPDVEPLPPEVLDRKTLADDLKRALDLIPVTQRTVLVMHYLDQMTFQEIADVLKKPLGTVLSWHRRGLLRLKDFFA
ncbi:MAG: RNA polymerase sigma factor [bacterium]